MAQWNTRYEPGGFPIERAIVGNFGLSVVYVDGEWQWLVQQHGQDLAEGASRAARAAKQQAEAIAIRLMVLATSREQRDGMKGPSSRQWGSSRAA